MIADLDTVHALAELGVSFLYATETGRFQSRRRDDETDTEELDRPERAIGGRPAHNACTISARG
jgi:hypothetical protein